MNKKISLSLAILVLSAMMISACSSAAQSTPVIEPEVREEVVVDPYASSEDVQDDIQADAQEDSQTARDLETWYFWDLTDVNSGTVFKVADFQGKVVLVETMAVWCSNCFKQQQEVIRLHDLVGERDDFVSIGVNIDPNEDVDTLSRYTSKNGFDWLYVVASPELIDEISRLYGTQYLNPPSTPMLIIDRQGTAHQLPFGIKSAEDLQSALEPFLNEG